LKGKNMFMSLAKALLKAPCIHPAVKHRCLPL